MTVLWVYHSNEGFCMDLSKGHEESDRDSTILGLLSILFWSTVIAFSRILSEQLGILTSACYLYYIGSLLGCIYLIAKKKSARSLLDFPKKYLFGCGALFVIYSVCIYLAIGLASGRQQVLEIGIINYLWPSLTLVLSIPILNKHAKPFLYPGIILALSGVFIATTQNSSLSWNVFRENLGLNYIPYILAFIASISWGLYNNLSRKWGETSETSAVPLFLLGTALVLTIIRFSQNEVTHWTFRGIMELTYMAIFPTFLGYVFWDIAMRKGRLILLNSLSYLIPLISTLISCLYLKVGIGLPLLVACVLVIAGAVVCKYSIVE